MMHRQSQAELIAHLCEQVNFLHSSGAAFDTGDDAEAKRLALHARILCHDTARSRSLLGQLGLLDVLRFVDSTHEDLDTSPGAAASEEGLVWLTPFLSALAPASGGPRGFVALLDRAPLSAPKPFSVWWNQPVIRDGVGNEFARRDVVLALANRDGGAHVDPETPPSYTALSRQNSLGIISYTTAEGQERVVEVNPALATMRQVAFELVRTLEPVLGVRNSAD
jgi:hypothetical protein